MFDPRSRSAGIVALLAAGLVAAACASNRNQQPPGEYIEDSVVTTKVEIALGAGEARHRCWLLIQDS